MKKENLIELIIIIFPIMFYYLVEALLVGIFINGVWKFQLEDLFGNLGYLQIVGIYWIIKMLFFDMVGLVTSLGVIGEDIIEEEFEDGENH